VGYPKKKDGSKDGRRMCVSCGGRWVDGNDLSGMTLVPAANNGSGSTAIGGGEMLGGESPRSKARREMYGLGSSVPVSAASIKGKETAATTEEDEEYELDDEEDYLKGLQATVSCTSPVPIRIS